MFEVPVEEAGVVEGVTGTEAAVDGVRNLMTSLRPPRFKRTSLPALFDVRFTRFFSACEGVGCGI